MFWNVRKTNSNFFCIDTFPMILKIKKNPTKINISVKICWSIICGFSQNLLKRIQKNVRQNRSKTKFIVTFISRKISDWICSRSSDAQIMCEGDEILLIFKAFHHFSSVLVTCTMISLRHLEIIFLHLAMNNYWNK